MWTDKDPLLSRIRTLIQQGWSTGTDDPQLNRKDELSVLDNCVLCGSRVVIPVVGRETLLQQLHEAHPGVSKMKSLARCYIWWPKIDSDIENLVRSCEKCQSSRGTPTKAPVHPWEWPHRPWSRLHIDHAGPYLGHLYFIVVDAHSKCIDAHIVSSETTIKKLTEIFSIHGIPDQIVSDNAPGFTSETFQQFMSQNGIKHTFVSPYHPSSNGLAERSVQIIKQGISKQGRI